MDKRMILIAAGLLLTRGALAMCFEVYSGERLVYRSTETPVDMSRPLRETVPAAFGGGSTLLFFPETEGCTSQDARRSAPVLSNEDVGSKFTQAQGPARNLERFFRDRESGSRSRSYGGTGR
jgi:hypothetical protein